MVQEFVLKVSQKHVFDFGTEIGVVQHPPGRKILRVHIELVYKNFGFIVMHILLMQARYNIFCILAL